MSNIIESIISIILKFHKYFESQLDGIEVTNTLRNMEEGQTNIKA